MSASQSPSSSAFASRIRLSEIISALSFALDATEGALPGHSLRCCLLGMRIGAEIGLPAEELASLYYALQLKDAGCSSNAARMSAMMGGGDDHVLKNAFKLTDWTRSERPDLRYLLALWKQCLPRSGFVQRVQHLVDLGRSPENNTAAMLTLRCERGAAIAHQLEMGGAVEEAVRSLDEHWDGTGYPEGLQGAAISPLSRVCSVAQHLDMFAVFAGPAAAVQALRTRRQSWYDPELIRAVRSLHRRRELWQHCRPNDNVEETRRAVLALDPGTTKELTGDRIDRICEAFAGIVDAKSPFTYRHSIGVTQVACAVAEKLGSSVTQADDLRRSALLHDIGKLAVPNSILDKAGKLTAGEWRAVRRHPSISGEILRRVPAFTRVASLAEQHHERLDGSGYPNALRDGDLSLESRILAVSDSYAAMAEDRPYRNGMSRAAVLAELAADRLGKLDSTCIDALEAVMVSWPGPFPTANGPMPVEAVSTNLITLAASSNDALALAG